MFITLETDYAVRIVSELSEAYRSDIDARVLGAAVIAERTNVTLRFSLKILRKLVAAGIVRSYKGAHGGYELTRDPAEITLRDVVEAIEGTYYFSRCLSPDSECSRGEISSCRYRRAFGEISEAVREKLGEYTFADNG